MGESIEFLFNDLEAGPYIPDVPIWMIRQMDLMLVNLRALGPFGGPMFVFMSTVPFALLYGLLPRKKSTEAHTKENEEEESL